jgi:antitoxin Phd
MNTHNKAVRTNQKRKSPGRRHRLALLPAKSARFTATEAKNEFGRLLEKAMRGDVVVITKHDAPKAILMSVDEFKILSGAAQSKINTLSDEFDSLLTRMQGPAAVKSMEAAFHASPERLGKTAIAAARKRG